MSIRCSLYSRQTPKLRNDMMLVISHIALSTTAFAMLQIIKRVASGATHRFYFCSFIWKFFNLTDSTKVTRWPKEASTSSMPAERNSAGGRIKERG